MTILITLECPCCHRDVPADGLQLPDLCPFCGEQTDNSLWGQKTVTGPETDRPRA